MVRNAFKISVILLPLVSCSIGKMGVFYDEMGKKPQIEIHDERITVKTSNSIQNSALVIYDIEISIDTLKKTIELKGFQALNKSFKTVHELKTKNLSKQELEKFDYFWIDPDDNRNKIEDIIK